MPPYLMPEQTLKIATNALAALPGAVRYACWATSPDGVKDRLRTEFLRPSIGVRTSFDSGHQINQNGAMPHGANNVREQVQKRALQLRLADHLQFLARSASIARHVITDQHSD